MNMVVEIIFWEGNHAWCHVIVIPALRGVRQKTHVFSANLGNMVSNVIMSSTEVFCLMKKLELELRVVYSLSLY